MNIPNLISLSRLFAVPIVVWLIISDIMLLAFWLCLIAALSDAVDGIIAKKFNAETELGAYLDPIADKALLVGVYVSLGYGGYLPSWLVILVVFRDLVIIGGAVIYQTITMSLKMEPLMISKVNTAAQLLLGVTVIGFNGYDFELDRYVLFASYVVALTTIASGTAYVLEWMGRVSNKANDEQDEL